MFLENDSNNNITLNNLGTVYYNIAKYELAEKYYLMAIDKGNNSGAVHDNLANVYYKQNKYELAKEYYLISIEKGYHRGILDLEQLYKKNSLRLYHTLIKISNKNDLINNKINELRKDKSIICFENKKNIFSKVEECPICFEIIILIPRECTHYYCCDCFVKINECAICRI